MAADTVVGWVHHAWRLLAAELGDDAPDYPWVEAAARTYGLARLCPHPKGGVDATRAVSHLRVFHANRWQPPDRRPPRTPTPRQETLF